jgi:hypothetical protein
LMIPQTSKYSLSFCTKKKSITQQKFTQTQKINIKNLTAIKLMLKKTLQINI